MNAQQQFTPSPSPRVSPGGGQPDGGEGTFFKLPRIEYGLPPLLKRAGLTPPEILATLVALTQAVPRGGAWLVEWSEADVMRNSATARSASSRAKKKLLAAGLIVLFKSHKKGNNSAVYDVTDLMTKGKK
jgi:hypothetical protein